MVAPLSLHDSAVARQKQICVKADRLAVQIEKIYNAAWLKLLDCIDLPLHHAQKLATAICRQLQAEVLRQMYGGLQGVGDWSFSAEVAIQKRNVPQDVQLALLELATPLYESIGLQEMLRKDVVVEPVGPADAEIEFEPVNKPDPSWRERVKASIFPAPTTERARQILLDGSIWPDRKSWPRRLAGEGLNYNRIISTIVTGVAGGKSAKDIAPDLEPMVNGVRSRAMRIARTEALRVAGKYQQESWKNLIVVTAGYKIGANPSLHSDPEHLERSGTIFYLPDEGKSPTTAEMPELPDHPNCRCHYTLVLSPEKMQRVNRAAEEKKKQRARRAG